MPKNIASDSITLDDKDKGKEKINFSTEGDIVVCSLMDKVGNLWFGTTGKGIFCYDGKTFKNFSQSDGLCNNTVFSIAEDKTGNILFGTLNGISRYDGKSFTGIQIPVADSADLYPFSDESSDSAQKKESLSLKTVLAILQDKTGNFWFGTFGGGVYRYNGKSFTNFLNNEGAVYEDGLRHSVIQSILEDKSGNIWFASMSHGGVYRYDGKTFKNFSVKEGLSDDMVSCIMEDKDGDIWFGTRDGGLSRYDARMKDETGQGKSFTIFSKDDGLSNKNVSCLMEDKTGILWLGSDRGGVSYYDGKTFIPFKMKEDRSNNHVRTILEDNTGNLWFGSRFGGLWRYTARLKDEVVQRKSLPDGKAGFTDFSGELK